MAMRRIRTRGQNPSQLPTRQGDLQRGSRGFCGKEGMSIFITCCLVVAILLFSSTDPGKFLRQKRPASVLPEAKDRLPTSAGVLSNDTSGSDPALLAQSLSGTKLTDQGSDVKQSATQAASAAQSSAASSNATADLLTVSADGAQAGGASAESAADTLAAVANGVAAAASKVHVVADRAAANLAQQQGKQAQGAGQAAEADNQLLAAGVAKQQALEQIGAQQSALAEGVAPYSLIHAREGELPGDSGSAAVMKPDASDDKAAPPSAAAEDSLEAKQLPLMKPATGATQPPSVFRAAAAEAQASEAGMQQASDSLLQRGQGQNFGAKGGQALTGGLETEPAAVLDDDVADFEPSEQALLDQLAERGSSQSGGYAGVGSGQSELEKTAAEVVGARSQQKLVLPEAAATGAGSQAAGRGSAVEAAAGGTATGTGTGTGAAGDPQEAADDALQAEDAAAQTDLLDPARGAAAGNQAVLSDTAVGAAGGSMASQSKGGSQEAVQSDPEALAEFQGEAAEAAVRDGSAAAAGKAAGADSMLAEAEAEPLAEAKPWAGAAKSAVRDGSAAAANAAAAAESVLAEAAGAEPQAQAAEAAAADSGTDAYSVAAAAQSVLAEGAAAEGAEEAAALGRQAARRALAQRRQVWACPGISPTMSL